MKSIVIWGVGAMAEGLSQCFDEDAAEIICYVDSDVTKQGKEYNNKKIIAPNSLKEVAFDYVFISSTIYQREIMNVLLEMGIERQKIVPASVTNADLSRIFPVLTEKGLIYIEQISSRVRQDYLSKNIKQKLKKLDKLDKLDTIDNKLIWMRKQSKHGYLKAIYEADAAEYIAENFIDGPEAPGKTALFESRWDYFKYVISRMREKDGLYLEFGVFKGESINFISGIIDGRKMYGFDCFEGLPEDWLPLYGKGVFGQEGNLPPVNDNVELVKGMFDETLPGFLEEHKGEKCSFVHIDSDLYSSAKYVLTTLKDHIGNGTIICFDEFAGHIGWRQDEYKAFMEFIEETGYKYRFVAGSYVDMTHRCGERVAIEIL